jgi:hypothetical protein
VFLCFVLRLLSLFLILNIMIRIRVREKNEGKHSNLLLPKAASKPYTGVSMSPCFFIPSDGEQMRDPLRVSKRWCLSDSCMAALFF